VAATRPGSRQLAVEADAEVADLVRRRLPVGRAQPGTGRIGVRLGDARGVLGRLPAGSYDVAVADLFDGGRTPAHLTTVEFTRAAARVLADGGIFAVNVGDGPPLAHARGRIAAVRAVFAQVCVLAEPAVLRGRRFGNLVVLGAGGELPLAGLTRRLAADPFPARVMAGDELDRFTAGAAPIEDAGAEPSPPMPPEIFA
jgi:spermidine synthase